MSDLRRILHVRNAYPVDAGVFFYAILYYYGISTVL